MRRLRKRIAIGAALVAAPIVFCAPACPAAAAAPVAIRQAPQRAPRAPRPGRVAPHGPVAVRALTHLGGISRYAYVERSTIARSTPSATGRHVGVLRPTTFWGTSTLVLALEQTTGRPGHTWTEVRLAQRPNNVPGWVPTSALSTLRSVDTWLRVDRETFTATLIRDGQVVFQAPVGVGQPQWPTPTGQFFIEESLTPPESGSLYGPLAFGTSAHSDVLGEWPNKGQIGVHGTNEPWLIPGRISHGCVRLRNEDILRLGKLMPVGTPVTIS